MLLAHMGGVPEALSVVVPLLAVGAFVLMERSARRKARAGEDGQPPVEDRET